MAVELKYNLNCSHRIGDSAKGALLGSKGIRVKVTLCYVPKGASARLPILRDDYNLDSTSIRRPFDCLSKVIKVTVTKRITGC